MTTESHGTPSVQLDGNEIWEWLNGQLEGDVPPVLDDGLLGELAQHINTHFLRALSLTGSGRGVKADTLAAAIQRLIGRGNGLAGYLDTPDAIEAGAVATYNAWVREAETSLALALAALSPEPTLKEAGGVVAWISEETLADLKNDEPWVAGAFGEFSQRKHDTHPVPLVVASEPITARADEALFEAALAYNMESSIPCDMEAMRAAVLASLNTSGDEL